MKIKELLKVLKCDSVTVAWNGRFRELDLTDDLMMQAYGDFSVQNAAIYPGADGEKPVCEITVAAVAVREAS